MKKKEVLVIFLLAVVLAGVNHYFYSVQGYFSRETFPLQILSVVILYKAAVPSCSETEGKIVCPSVSLSSEFYLLLVIFDFLFWFLVLATVWWVVGKVKRRLFDKI